MTESPFSGKYANRWAEEGKKIPRELINQVRRQVLNYAEDHEARFDPRDIERIAIGSDWAIERFFLEYADADQTECEPGGEPYRRLKSYLLWRKAIGVNNLEKSTFPRHFFRSGLICLNGEDNNGGQILLIRASSFLPIPKDWEDLFFKYLAYWIERADRRNGTGNGVTVLIDGKQIDRTPYSRSFAMKLLLFVCSLLHEWYPKLVSVVVLHKLPKHFSHIDIHLFFVLWFKEVRDMEIVVTKYNRQLNLCKLTKLEAKQSDC